MKKLLQKKMVKEEVSEEARKEVTEEAKKNLIKIKFKHIHKFYKNVCK